MIADRRNHHSIRRQALFEPPALHVPKHVTPKKEQGGEALLSKIVSTLLSRKFDLILLSGVTLLLRVRVPPETWTTRPGLAASLRLHS
jgi:hypothetical protein